MLFIDKRQKDYFSSWNLGENLYISLYNLRKTTLLVWKIYNYVFWIYLNMCNITLFNINMNKNDNHKESSYASVIHLHISGNSYIMCNASKSTFKWYLCLMRLISSFLHMYLYLHMRRNRWKKTDAEVEMTVTQRGRG